MDIRLSSSSLFYAPGMVEYFKNMTHKDFSKKKDTLDKAVQHYMLGQLYPKLSFEAAEKILNGDFTVDGDDVVVTLEKSNTVTRQDIDDGGPI